MKRRWLWRDLVQWIERGHRRALVLTGARQTGKTTLARAAAADRLHYLGLDDPIVRTELLRLPATAFARRFPAAVLDEVQKAPALLEVVKAVLDTGGIERYLLLGSSHVLLLARTRESLVGRTALRRLFPLGLAEACSEAVDLDRPAPAPFLLRLLGAGPAALAELPESVVFHPRSGELQQAMDRLLAWGGMPGIWEEGLDSATIQEELETYTTLYLERDLADLARLRDLEPFITLQRLAAERTAGVLNASALARDAGISHETARTYLRYLELSFQVVLLRPWFANRSKRLIRSPKLHWLDVGVWRSVTRRWDGLSGELYESAVVSEVLKVLGSFRTPWEAFHLRTHDGLEIDLLLVSGDEVIAVEIKKAERVTTADLRHLRRVEDVTGRRMRMGLVIHRGGRVLQLDEGFWAVPDVLLFGEPAA